MAQAQALLDNIIEDIESDRIKLPSMPEVALKIQQTVEDPEVSVQKLSEVIGHDAVLTAKMIQIANSPLLRGSVQIESLNMAITRLGLKFVQNLAMGLAMEHIFQATNENIDRLLRDVWHNSTEVSAIAHVLASNYTDIAPDEAMLAGLLHEIGILPILTLAEENEELLQDPQKLNELIVEIHPQLGSHILQHWGFPAALSQVPANFLDFSREVPEADFVDIVTVAKLQSVVGSNHPLANVDWTEVKAFERLGLDPEVDIRETEPVGSELKEAIQLFS